MDEREHLLNEDEVNALVAHLDREYREKYFEQSGIIPGLWHHKKGNCLGEYCTIHNPSDHSMRDLPLHWRGDRAMFERICIHGVGHPDVDQARFWKITEEYPGELDYYMVHGCDGCCAGAYDGIV